MTLARQQMVGLTLAAATIAVWVAIHIVGVFAWRWSPLAAIVAMPLVLLQAWLSTGLFIVAHDAMHGSLAPGRPRLNRALGTLCLALYAQLSYPRFLPNHMAHHRHVGTARDPDFHARDPRASVGWFVHFFARYFDPWQFVRLTSVTLVYTLVLGASLVNVLVFWAVPSLLAVVQLFVFGIWLPHRHGDDAFPDHHNARNVTRSPLLSLVSCFHFGGYHHEHHLRPGTPWWRLPSEASARS